MPRGDQVGSLADDVIALLQKGNTDFAKVFYVVVRQRGLRLDREAFREKLKAVQKRAMKRKVGKDVVLPTLPSFVRKRHGRSRPRKVRPKEAQNSRMYFPHVSRFLEKSPDRGYIYPDNNGFFHPSTSPFLLPAYEADD